MTHMNEFEIDPYRAAMIYRHFEKIHMRIIDGELDYGEGEMDVINIGDPYDHSIRVSIGYLEDSKYGIHLSWCSMFTLTDGTIQRYTATVDRSRDGGETINHLILERCEDVITGMFYCPHKSFDDDLHPNEIVSHLIQKDLREYPSVDGCCCH